jgi:hypothetical protein
MYLKTLLTTRAVDDPEIATFLACWLYEETFHGRAIARFLGAAGAPVGPRPTPRSWRSLGDQANAIAVALLARTWPDFVAVHMTWGAINELTTLTGYDRLRAVGGHPVLGEVLGRIMRDESRHFYFYFRQAERRLQRPLVARVARAIIDRFWAPVGSGVQPAAETRFLASYLFAGAEGRAAARRVDETIRRLPGFGDAQLLEAWIDRYAGDPGGADGGGVGLRVAPVAVSRG